MGSDPFQRAQTPTCSSVHHTFMPIDMSTWLSRTQPPPIEALLDEFVPQTIMSFLLCYALDGAVLRFGLIKTRWFTLHTVVNAIVVLLSARDTFETLRDPIHAIGGPASTLAISLVIALHVYHAVFFKLTEVDIIHHVVSVGIMGPLAAWYRPGVFINYVCFFVSGLPGGIDYAMLALVKHGARQPRFGPWRLASRE